MEQHPIPQNVTGFEFKLIGEMTIKQFAYLAGCAFLAYLFFASPLHPLIKFPLAVFFALLGVGLAFIPIEGRPMDKWIRNFIRALFSPNQYLYHKDATSSPFLKSYTQNMPVQTVQKQQPTTASINKTAKLTQYIETLNTPTQPDENKNLASINELLMTQPIAQPVPAAVAPAPVEPTVIIPEIQPSIPAQKPEEEKVAAPQETQGNQPPANVNRIEEENQKLKAELEELKTTLARDTADPTPAHMQEAIAIQQKLQEVLSEKERLSSELLALQQKLTAQQTGPVVIPSPREDIVRSKVNIVAPTQAKQVGLASIPQYPNIVSGIVKDIAGEILPNIIVEVKDANNNPVRAFKTNKLGQFSAATSLASGKYVVLLEDPKGTYTFDAISIEFNGGIFQPLEIIARDPAMNERDKLREALFGGKGATSN